MRLAWWSECSATRENIPWSIEGESRSAFVSSGFQGGGCLLASIDYILLYPELLLQHREQSLEGCSLHEVYTVTTVPCKYDILDGRTKEALSHIHHRLDIRFLGRFVDDGPSIASVLCHISNLCIIFTRHPAAGQRLFSPA